MEALPNDGILQFNPDTLVAIRKQYNLDRPGRMDEAIAILVEWLKKQDHFVKKDFSRNYLERTLITCKGSVERAKMRLDKLCTLKLLLPQYFGVFNIKKDFKNVHEILHITVMPKLTVDNARIFFVSCIGKQFDPLFYTDAYRYGIVLCEYLRAHEYCNGFHVVIDLRETNMVDLLAKLSLVELRQIVTLLIEGYGLRLKSVNIITPSKMIDVLIGVGKQVLNDKIFSRFHTHKTLDTLEKIIDVDLLPVEYGGKETSLNKIHERWINVLSSDEHINYLEYISKAATNEDYRPSDKFTEQYAGMPGSFRSLYVD